MLKFIKKLFISLIPLIILYFIWKEILENDVKITGFLSYYYLVFILLISPLAYVFYKFKYLKRYSNLVTSFRRPIWIITWILVLFHWLKFEERLYKLWEQYYSSKISFFDFTYNWVFNSTTWTILWMNTYSFWFWIIGIIMMILLLITSNNISQKILWSKVWKNLQKLIYPLFIIIVLHIYFVWWWKWLYLYPAIIIFSLRFYTWFDKNFQYKWQSQISHSWYRRFLCLPCGFIYDEELWDADGWLIPWTKFEEIPDDWRCPVCWVTKKDFTLLDGHYNPENIENHELIFELKWKKYLTENVLELAFYCERDLEIIPGQFCNLIYNHNNQDKKIARSYSVVKYIDNIIYFGIKLKLDGEWSDMLRKIKVWEKIKALWPFGDFILKNTSNKKVFIATGTWLSPIYNMILSSWNIEKELYFWVQKKSDLFYLAELKNIPNLKVHIFISRERVKWYNYWRIHYDKIHLDQNTEVYMCGSPWLIDTLRVDFKNNWNTQVYYEKFL